MIGYCAHPTVANRSTDPNEDLWSGREALSVGQVQPKGLVGSLPSRIGLPNQETRD